MSKGDEKIKEIFQDAFESFEAPVSPSAWSGIELGLNAGAGGSAAGGSSLGSWVSANVGWVVSGVVAVSAAAIIAVSTLGDSPKNENARTAAEQTELIEEQDKSTSSEENQQQPTEENQQNDQNIQPETEPSVNENSGDKKVGEQKQSNAEPTTGSANESSSLNNNSAESTGSDHQENAQETSESSEANSVSSSTTNPGKEENSNPDSEVKENTEDELPITALSGDFQYSVDDDSPLSVSFEAEDSSADEYYWTFGDGQSAVTSSPSVAHDFSDQGVYEVKLRMIRNQFEIQSEKEIEVFGKPKLVLPNVFSPNGDGQNDFYTIDFKESKNIESYTLRVFTLEGEQIFKSHSDKAEWNGELPNGANAPEGKYVVVVKAFATSGDQLRSKPKVITLTR